MKTWRACAAVLGALVWSGSAGADAVGDMKACAAVGDGAVRLACYDAAAKTVGKAEGAAADIAACAKVSTDEVRLACFDAVVKRVPGAAGSAATPAPAASAAASAAADAAEKEAAARERAMALEMAEANEPTKAEEDAFGAKYVADDEAGEGEFGTQSDVRPDPLTAETVSGGGRKAKKDKTEDDNRTRDGKLKSITVRITNIRFNPYGKVRVTLENGQVWKQIDTGRVRYDKNGENFARIRRAMLGSFLMTINDEGAAVRVRRVK